MALVVKAVFEVCALHGVHGDAALGEIWLLVGVEYVLKGIVRAPGNAVGGIERGVHESARVGSAEGERGLTEVAPAPDCEGLATGGNRRLPLLECGGNAHAGDDDKVRPRGGDRRFDALGAQGGVEFGKCVFRGRTDFAFVEDGDRTRGKRGEGEQEQNGDVSHGISVIPPVGQALPPNVT